MTTANRLRVAIVGAGIGGLTTAIALLRDGHDVVCFDKTKELREVGAGLQLTPNATRVLIRLGLGDELHRAGVEPTVHEVRRWQNDAVLMSTELAPLSRQRWGAPRYCMHRADLHEALRAAVPSSVIRLGARCERVVTEGDDISIELSDGTKHEADVVIAADGLRSVIRDSLAKDSPVFSGQHSFRGLVPRERVPEHADPKLRVWLGPERSVAAYPVSAGRLVNFAGVFPATEEFPESWTSEGRVDQVLAMFDGWNDSLRSLLAAADKVLVLPLYDRVPITKWSYGRLTLLGDAAHPMFPFLAQGAVQAIEDAASLAKYLRGKGPDGVVEALRGYEIARMERTARVQSGARDTFAHLPDGEEQRKRDEFLARPRPPGPRDWLWGYDPELEAPWDPSLAS